MSETREKIKEILYKYLGIVSRTHHTSSKTTYQIESRGIWDSEGYARLEIQDLVAGIEDLIIELFSTIKKAPKDLEAHIAYESETELAAMQRHVLMNVRQKLNEAQMLNINPNTVFLPVSSETYTSGYETIYGCKIYYCKSLTPEILVFELTENKQ